MRSDTASMTSSTLTTESVRKSPERGISGSLSMSGIGAKLSRILSNNKTSSDNHDGSTIVANDEEPTSPVGSRSRSRGREFTSSGRGGAGNIRPTSQSRPRDGPDDFSHTRGREVAPPPHLLPSPTGPIYSGRGGAGNIRSPSRGHGVGLETAKVEQEAILAAERDSDVPHSSGRGGFGNIVSRSRSRSRDASVTRSGAPAGLHSSGRGGAGNISIGPDGTILEEEERRASTQADGVHSTGRGGRANIVSGPPPHIDAVYQHGGVVYSSGRGGVGNIREASKTRSLSRTREKTKGE